MGAVHVAGTKAALIKKGIRAFKYHNRYEGSTEGFSVAVIDPDILTPVERRELFRRRSEPGAAQSEQRARSRRGLGDRDAGSRPVALAVDARPLCARPARRPVAPPHGFATAHRPRMGPENAVQRDQHASGQMG